MRASSDVPPLALEVRCSHGSAVVWRGAFQAFVPALAIRPGERVGLVGPSGSGKTAIAHALAGLTPVDGGTLFVEGFDWWSMPPSRRRVLRRQYQMVFQSGGATLRPKATVLHNLEEPLIVHGFEKPPDALIEGVLEAVQLRADILQRLPSQLSGGQRYRCALARALLLRPRILILDEPTTGLDIPVGVRLIDTLRRLNVQFDSTLILISHSFFEVAALCQTYYRVAEGHMVGPLAVPPAGSDLSGF